MTAPLLELRGVSAAYGQIEVLHGIDLTLQAGQVLTVLGPNGAGKTSTVKVIAGLLTPTNGRVELCGRDVTSASADQLSRAGVCVVPEGRGIFPRLSVEEHLKLSAWGAEGREARVQIFDAFPRLYERRKQLAGTMSGGEQQMLALSRAIARRPALLVVDELSMGLAPLVVEQLYEHVRAIATQGVSIVLVEQFIHDVLGIADVAVVMQNGTVVRSGHPDDLAEDLAGLYLAASL
ncbi:ABC transporter ATP-binding protein [Microtetraspora sp. NBRC 16547]|uniref:ABC transporter ATP-binding protein n=1 Tax=Microtetraspora sp. NBRC 16547 TaxID=3030993 RepID=UPI0024A45008|nr:ABC transporter ATP-binding protein [Microtetraspora sp. NBRC 16547]GLX02665.1 ABC transporter ATP-binding protein [Microtetraspora sp. NBRC 16547]